MNKVSQGLIVSGGFLLMAFIVAIVGYFFAKDKDAIAFAFAVQTIISGFLWLKAKNANL